MHGYKEELKNMEERVEITHELGSYQRRMINQGREEANQEVKEKMRALGYTEQQIQEIYDSDL